MDSNQYKYLKEDYFSISSPFGTSFEDIIKFAFVIQNIPQNIIETINWSKLDSSEFRNLIRKNPKKSFSLEYNKINNFLNDCWKKVSNLKDEVSDIGYYVSIYKYNKSYKEFTKLKTISWSKDNKTYKGVLMINIEPHSEKLLFDGGMLTNDALNSNWSVLVHKKQFEGITSTIIKEKEISEKSVPIKKVYHLLRQ